MKKLSIKEKIKIILSIIAFLSIVTFFIQTAIEADENRIKKQQSYKEFIQSGQLKDSLDLFILDSIDSKNTVEKLIEIIENTDDTIVKNIAIDFRLEFHAINVERKEAKRKKKQEEKNKKVKLAKTQAQKLVKGKTDEFSGITWYENRRFTHYISYNRISLYIGYSPETHESWLRLKVSYSGNDWIFFNNIRLLCDNDKTMDLNFSYFSDKETDVLGGGDVSEWIDIPVNSSDLIYLKEFAKSNKSKIKFTGDKYYKKMTVSSTQKRAMLEVIEAYEILKNIN